MTHIYVSVKQKHSQRGQTCGCQTGWQDRWMDGEFGVSRCKLLYLEWITTRSYCIAQYPLINHNEKEYEKYIHIVASLCCTAEINTTL